MTTTLRSTMGGAIRGLCAVVCSAALVVVALSADAAAESARTPAALAALGTLRASDLPAGWVAGTLPLEAAEPIPAIKACMPLRSLQSHALSYGHSGRLYEGAVGDGNNYISESATVYPSTAFAQMAIAQRVSNPMRRCIGDSGVAYIKSRLPDATVTWQVQRETPPDVGDHSALLTHTTKVVDPQANVTFYSQLQFVQVGRTVVALNVATEGAPKWSALRARLAQLLAHRLRHGDSDTT